MSLLILQSFQNPGNMDNVIYGQTLSVFDPNTVVEFFELKNFQLNMVDKNMINVTKLTGSVHIFSLTLTQTLGGN